MKPFLLSVSLFGALLTAIPALAQTKFAVRVLDSKGAPIVGANVEAQIWREGAKPVAPQTTDANGAASFAIPEFNGKPASAGISVVAPGFAFKNAALKAENVEITLQPGVIWRGKVTDEAGKPVAGASVRVMGAMLGNVWESGVSLFGKRNSAAYTTQTGADGSFSVADVPAKMGLRFEVEHPDYAVKGGNDALPDAPAIIKLALGGSVRGRVLNVAGRPIAHALVHANPQRLSDSPNGGQTDENGVFIIPSLATGTYNIDVTPESLGGNGDFLVLRVLGVPVEAGKTNDAPDLRAVKSFQIQGVVRDTLTKKPLEGVQVGAQQGPDSDDTSAFDTSNAEGRFILRVVAGEYRVSLLGVPHSYKWPKEQKGVVVGEIAGEIAPTDIVFDLQKARQLRGTMVDEAGKPLQAKIKISYDSFIESDAAGKWQYVPQNEGNDQNLQLAGGDAEDGYFEVVSPRSIALDTQGEIAIVLKKLPWQILPGRALTSEGKPLQGVQIDGEFYTDMGDGGGSLNTSKRVAISNANGDFVLPQIRDGIRATGNYFKISGKKAGYAFQKGGELSKNGPVWQTSDLIFVPLSLKVEGTTTPGARLTAAGIEILAGQDGKFVFEGLPASETRIWAQKGGGFGGAAAKTPTLVELQTQEIQPRDPDMARDIWSDIATDAGRGTKGETYGSLPWISRRLAAPGDGDLTVELAKTTGDYQIAQMAARVAGKVPFAALDAALQSIKDPDTRLYAYLSAAAKTDDKALGARALQEAETNFKAPEKTGWWREMNLYRTAAVAARFEGEAAGIAALDRAVAYTIKNHGEKSTRKANMPDQTGRDEMFAMNAESVAPGGLALVRRLISNIEPGAGYESRALGEAIPILAQNGGAEATLPLFDELEKMPESVKRDEGYSMSPQRAFTVAAGKVVPLLGLKSPEKALNLARRVRGDDYMNESKWSALASAGKFQSGEVAAKLWREIVSGAGAMQAPRYAARAFDFDPKLGHELFGVALGKVEADSKNEWQSRELWAGYAFYSARADAAPARFIIEREWGAARQKKVEGEELGALALAMAALDGPRAWQMAREIPNDNRFASFDARRKIGIYLAASEETRRNFPLGRQGNWEEWRAIEEE